MREIKFRAFIKSIQKLIDVEWIDFKNKQITYNSIDFEGFGLVDQTSFEDIELIEYTGLKDRNGKEIYEGDVIYYNIDNGVGIEHYQARVVWSENTTEYKNRFEWLIIYSEGDGFDGLSRPAAYNSELLVVGNIYEHPHLLEALK